jgi:hypothetical protein
MGEVIPSVASEIVLEDGASVTVKAPSLDWPIGGSVNFITMPSAARDSVKFSAILSAGHLASIKLNGKRVMQDSVGCIRPVAFRMIIR